MKTFEFTIYFSEYDELSEELTNAIFEAGCDDGLLGSSQNRFSVCFGREAETFADAVLSAITDLQKVPGLQVTDLSCDSDTDKHDADLINRMLHLQVA